MADDGLAASLAATAANGYPWQQQNDVDWSKFNQPTGELKPASLSPSQRVQSTAQDAMIAAGAHPYVAGHLAEGLMGLVQASPLAVPLGAADTAYYKSQDNPTGAALAAAAMIPGAKPAAKAAAKIAQPLIEEGGLSFLTPRATGMSPADQLAEILAKGKAHYSGPLISGGSAGIDAPVNAAVQTVSNPRRMMYPGIYRDPSEIAATAAQRVVPEDPAMKLLWGVNRQDLEDIGRGRVGTQVPPITDLAANPKGAASGMAVMTPQNTQRLIDILGEGGKYPGLAHADAWYVMDPVYHRLVQMFGPEEALQRYRTLNTMTGMASPGSDVLTEIQRGTGAHWLNQQGRWEDFRDLGGVAEPDRGGNFPDDMRYIVGHPYHPTAQVLPMERFLREGEMSSAAPKVPSYVQASGVPATGFQTRFPVGDAHFSRGIGLADVRKGPTDVGASWSPQEFQTLSPWWREEVARKLGIEAVPAQARLWTVLGPQTGVESPLGQGKLELFSQQIMKAANRLGVTSQTARDLILSGKAGAGLLAGTAGLGAALSGAANPQQRQQEGGT